MMKQNKPLQNPRVIIIQQLYSKEINKDSELIFPKHPILYSFLFLSACIIPISLFDEREKSIISKYFSSNMFNGRLELGKNITPLRGKRGIDIIFIKLMFMKTLC